MPQPSISSCFKAISKHECDYSLIPFENSSNGPVVLSYDLFRDFFVQHSHRDWQQFKGPDFEVIAEQFVSIHHNFISFGRDLGHVQRIYSHPQVWSQCNRFLEQLEEQCDHKIEKIDVSSTSKAVSVLSMIKSRDQQGKSAAIASATASEIHGVPIQRTNIEDVHDNTTRFLVLGNRGSGGMIHFTPRTDKKLSEKKMTLLTFIIKDNDNFGSLCNILQVFKQHNLNLQTISTRPSRISAWRYVFFVEVWYEEKPLSAALVELDTMVLDLAVIGTFYRPNKFFDMVGKRG
ncbi:hypothetical protein FOA43_003008 [Brettanomyces nanus]|uniref:prephenate dehydratase n=1 Tax=Eeniella nana TaxID=13502 RepID=A0A875S1P1_EENNA|nr:uncharacterized protein FOA43_003008 [Brettanomyces nanus]QPG75651.1 hypothetical protein FOA43_003008 [Brettanomyces nanus]